MMGIEIELKAWVDDPAMVSQIFTAIGAEFVGTFEKDDCYWIFPASLQELRIRKEVKTDPSGIVVQSSCVTYKTKEIQDGIEINDEQEFDVSDAGIFEKLFIRLGAIPKITKYKQGQAWNYNGITAELLLVRNLGHFIELEFISDSRDTQTVHNIKSRLMDLLSRLNISTNRIEPRYYTDLLIHGDL
ncbi:MAG: class IV adenylate cyclase [Spirochaetaceae bacterium]|jgi:adenylate cyclase class 2|nr:class IV adenylate cyclase [Spirochaetaceae bacterium]